MCGSQDDFRRYIVYCFGFLPENKRSLSKCGILKIFYFILEYLSFYGVSFGKCWSIAHLNKRTWTRVAIMWGQMELNTGWTCGTFWTGLSTWLVSHYLATCSHFIGQDYPAVISNTWYPAHFLLQYSELTLTAICFPPDLLHMNQFADILISSVAFILLV